MMSDRVIQLIYQLSRIPIRMYTERWELITSLGVTEEMEGEFDRKKFLEVKEYLGKEALIILKYNEQVPISLCGCRTEDGFCFLGPFCHGEINSYETKKFLTKNRLGEYPVACLENARNIMDYLLGYMEQNSQKGSGSLKEEQLHRDAVIEEARQWETFQENHTFHEEEAVFDYIRNGDVKFLESWVDTVILPHPSMLENEKKEEEYIVVLSVSFAARAAVAGGISSREAFLANDLFLKRIMVCKTTEEFRKIEKESFLYFSRLVRDKRQKRDGLNLYVEECKKAIITNRLNKIDISELAGKIGVSMEYLKKLFRQYEGISIAEYIVNIKMEAACNMLRFSDRSIGEIADYLSFGSLSHFSVAFKRKMKQSPSEYREACYRTAF